MQSYARFVEYIKHAHERRAYLCRKSYSLALAAGQRSGFSRQGEVSETDVFKKSQTRKYLFEYIFCNFCVKIVKFDVFEKFKRLSNRH